jgi:hypothetical protein
VVHAGATDVTIERNRIYENTRGLSIAAGFANIPPRNIILRNNLIYDNQKRAVVVDKVHSYRLLNNTFVNNPEGIALSQPVSGDACAFMNNLVASSRGLGDTCNANKPGSGNRIFGTAAEVKFVNVARRDLHLQRVSAAVDRGVAVADVPGDMDGQRRPAGRGYDVGADEYVE